MKKKSAILAIGIICCIVLNACSETEIDSESSTNVRQTEIESTLLEENEEIESESESDVQTERQEISNEPDSETPDNFVIATEDQLTGLPDTDGLIDTSVGALESIGVRETIGVTYGNYEKVGPVYMLDAYVVTDIRKLVVRNQYLSGNWSVVYINDAETGNLYYPVTAQNAYDYISGECINPVAEEEIVEIDESEETAHREGMYGISDKDVYDIGGPSIFERNDVRNDTTGNWKISTIAEDVQMVDYALSYYEKYFHGDDEVHGIVNFNYNTTTSITTDGYILYVDVYDYVDGEEHDAKLLFSGTLLQSYFVYLDNGDIEEVQ